MARFVEESTDQEWAPPQEERLAARLQDLDNPFLESLGVECQTSCCKMSFSFEYLKDYGEDSDQRLAYNAVLMDLQSDLGFGAWASSMQISGYDFYTCFARGEDERQQGGVDRLRDRRKLLAASMPKLVECLPEGRDSAMLNVLAVFRKDGTLSVKSSTPQNEIADCISNIINSWRTDEGGTEGFLSLPLLLTRE